MKNINREGVAKMKNLSGVVILLMVSCLLASCETQEQQNIEKPITFTSNNSGNKKLKDSPYGYEM
jgi:nitrous oxide reductase accessory protein NosL